MIPHMNRRFDDSQRAVCQFIDHVARLTEWLDQDELVPAEAGKEGVVQRFAEPGCQSAQQFVPRRVTKRIIDGFEIIEIHAEEGKLTAASLDQA